MIQAAVYHPIFNMSIIYMIIILNIYSCSCITHRIGSTQLECFTKIGSTMFLALILIPDNFVQKIMVHHHGLN